MKKICLVMFCSSILSAWTVAQPTVEELRVDIVKLYPQPGKYQNRYIIELPDRYARADNKIEILVSKQADFYCGYVWYGSKSKIKTVSGYGYTYLSIDEVDDLPMTTRKGCPYSPKQRKYVPVDIKHNLFSYNAILPLVVYAPKDVKISYKIWRTDNKVIDVVPK